MMVGRAGVCGTYLGPAFGLGFIISTHAVARSLALLLDGA